MKISLDLLAQLRHRAYNMRVLCLEATTEAGSGHPTTCLSAADLVAALFFYGMQYDPENPAARNNDRFILSKGHGAPLLYAAWKEVGVLTKEDVMGLRSFSSVLEGHPVPRFPYVEAATGSLGMGLSIGLGMAIGGQRNNRSFYTYVLLGDSEMTEGSVWEAIELAAYYNVNRLIAIVDFNRLGQSIETIDDHDPAKHEERWKAFGWHTITIDGHDMKEIVEALDEAKKEYEKPTVIIAKTFKGYGIEVEDKMGYHGKAFSKEELPKMLKQLEERFKEDAKMQIEPPKLKPYTPRRKDVPEFTLPPCSYSKDAKVAPRKAFGETLVQLGTVLNDLIVLDAEVKNSTFTQLFEDAYPSRFIESFIAEQAMIGMAIGLSSLGYIPFSATFASFFSRAHDQIRMAAINRSALRLAGTHVGVSIGQDGPSQMGLEDIGMMRALPDSVVLYPCDAVSTYALTQLAVRYQDGISYLRLTRAATPVIYEPGDTFFIGGSKVLKESDNDRACIVAAGITVFEALKAYEELKKRNILVSVIDLYSIKPLDYETIKQQALKANKKLITVEDHFLQGGMGEAVCYALRNDDITIEVLAVTDISRSGTPEELLAYHKIDHMALIEAVYKLLV